MALGNGGQAFLAIRGFEQCILLVLLSFWAAPPLNMPGSDYGWARKLSCLSMLPKATCPSPSRSGYSATHLTQWEAAYLILHGKWEVGFFLSRLVKSLQSSWENKNISEFLFVEIIIYLWLLGLFNWLQCLLLWSAQGLSLSVGCVFHFTA